jgi:DNA modification methylase
MSVIFIQGDVIEKLSKVPSKRFDCIVTSPPYWGLRDYGVDGQIGLEATLDEYLDRLATVFEELRRVLKDSGTCWLNIGDAYAGSWGAQSKGHETAGTLEGCSMLSARQIRAHPKPISGAGSIKRTPGLKPKDLMMIPARLALRLQEDGWYLRSEIIWHKSNAMPESVRDRPTSAHEKIFLLTKSEHYFFNAAAVREEPAHDGPNSPHSIRSLNGQRGRDRIKRGVPPRHTQYDSCNQSSLSEVGRGNGRNVRNVWTSATRPFSEAHFATFPPELVERCIKAGCPEGGRVLDPFGGAGTTGLLSDHLGRNCTLIELNPEYIKIARSRIRRGRDQRKPDCMEGPAE